MPRPDPAGATEQLTPSEAASTVNRSGDGPLAPGKEAAQDRHPRELPRPWRRPTLWADAAGRFIGRTRTCDAHP